MTQPSLPPEYESIHKYAKYLILDSNKTMSFKVSDKNLLKKCTKIWEKISCLIGKLFDNEPLYCDNDKCIKAKIKSYGDKTNTDVQGKKVPKENASCKCLSLIMIDLLSSNTSERV